MRRRTRSRRGRGGGVGKRVTGDINEKTEKYNEEEGKGPLVEDEKEGGAVIPLSGKRVRDT